ERQPEPGPKPAEPPTPLAQPGPPASPPVIQTVPTSPPAWWRRKAFLALVCSILLVLILVPLAQSLNSHQSVLPSPTPPPIRSYLCDGHCVVDPDTLNGKLKGQAAHQDDPQLACLYW